MIIAQRQIGITQLTTFIDPLHFETSVPKGESRFRGVPSGSAQRASRSRYLRSLGGSKTPHKIVRHSYDVVILPCLGTWGWPLAVNRCFSGAGMNWQDLSTHRWKNGF